jgi:peroxiredoxin
MKNYLNERSLMKKSIICLLTLLSLFSYGETVATGSLAPSFKLAGYPSRVDLSSFRGSYVVLEWYNDGCPFVRKHYDGGNMQAIQKKYKNKVKWLTINSSAEGKQGYLGNVSKAKKMYKSEKMYSTALLLDTNGKVGKSYGAKTTPHLFIINPKGIIIYQGAIDSIPSADSSDIVNSKNYVSLALDQALSGKKVRMGKTRPYGCSVKY